jgi:transposase-like protein
MPMPFQFQRTRPAAETLHPSTKQELAAAKQRRALKVIVDCRGNLTLAAERLGISVATLSKWRSAARVQLADSEMPPPLITRKESTL